VGTQHSPLRAKPDAVFYLRIGVDELIPAPCFSRFDYWESGMDSTPPRTCTTASEIQTALLDQFDIWRTSFIST